MKNHIQDGLQVIAALLLTGSMVSAMAPAQTTKTVSAKNTAIVKTVSKPVAPVQTAAVVTPTQPPAPEVTWHDNPNHCTDDQYIDATAPFACIDKPQAVSAPSAAPTAAPVAQVAAPVAQTSTDCVTGYSTGDIYLNKIIAYESGGRSCATNPGGCFGLLQACPGAPLRAACGGDPVCQIAWFQANKTGGRSWQQVWQHELDFGWW